MAERDQFKSTIEDRLAAYGLEPYTEASLESAVAVIEHLEQLLHFSTYRQTVETPEETTLKPCSYCGGEKPRIERLLRKGYVGMESDPDAYAYFGHCPYCGADGPWRKSAGGAAQMWNMRAGEDQAKNRIAELEGILDRHVALIGQMGEVARIAAEHFQRKGQGETPIVFPESPYEQCNCLHSRAMHYHNMVAGTACRVENCGCQKFERRSKTP